MSYKNRLYLYLSVLTVLAFLAAACTTATPTSAPEVEPTVVPTEPSEEGSPEPTEELPPEISENLGVWAFVADPPSLDPFLVATFETTIIGGNVYERLTFYDPSQEPPIVPKLAKSWESNEDGTEWTFNLQEGVKFHDGTDFNAEAVKFSIERASQPEAPFSYMYASLEEIEIIDDYTIRFHLNAPANYPLMMTAGWGGVFMVSPSAADKDPEWFMENSLGTGPYYIESYSPAQRVILNRFEDYWRGWEEGQFTKVVYEIVEDPALQEQMLRAGDADGMMLFGLAELIPSLEQEEGITVYTTIGTGNYIGSFNMAKSPTDDVLVRKALAYSIPYQSVVQSLEGGLASQSGGPVPASVWGSDTSMALTQDLDKAAELLADAGHSDGLNLTFDAFVDFGQFSQFAEIWKVDLAKIGVNLEINQSTASALIDTYQSNPAGAGDITGITWAASYISPIDFLMIFSTGYPYNFASYSNPEYDDLVNQVLQLEASDLDMATQTAIEAQKLLYEDMPGYFLLDVPDAVAVRSDILGFSLNPAYSYFTFWYDMVRK